MVVRTFLFFFFFVRIFVSFFSLSLSFASKLSGQLNTFFCLSNLWNILSNLYGTIIYSTQCAYFGTRLIFFFLNFFWDFFCSCLFAWLIRLFIGNEVFILRIIRIWRVIIIRSANKLVSSLACFLFSIHLRFNTSLRLNRQFDFFFFC